MVIPYDSELGIHPQAEGFLEHDWWDFDGTSPDQYPLLLHFPYFDLYRKQVVKQADLVLAMQHRPDAFTEEQKARNFEYYEGLTVRDSSLSANSQAVLAAEVGHLELAYDYLAEAALMDLDDLEHNTRDGRHIASLAGAVIGVLGGLGGLRTHDGALTFAPRLPEALNRVVFRVSFCDRRVVVDVRHEQARYTLLEGDPLEITHHGATVALRSARAVTRRIPPAPKRDAPRQPPGREPARRRPVTVSRIPSGG
jgi:alpha,alpha-trehalose phosphorylase